MSFDAFMYSPTHTPGQFSGETQDSVYSGLGAFEILSFELGGENNINIGSISSGGGAGKATIKEFTITKKTDTASAHLFHHLMTGAHFDDFTIDLRRSGESSSLSGGVFLKFEFLLMMIQDMSWSGADGDDVCEETIVCKAGAIQVTYQKQSIKGKMEKPEVSRWSQVLNNNTFAVT